MMIKRTGKRKPYTKEEIDLANSYSLPDLLRSCGYILQPDRRGEYHLKEHDSLKISEHNGWKWFSRDIGGKNIDFFMLYEGLDFLSAMDRIFSVCGHVAHSDGDNLSKPNSGREAAEKPFREFTAPERNENNRRAQEYLVNKRGLDSKLVKKLFGSGHIYEAKDTHNVVFLGTDYRCNIASSFERGSTDRKFARDTLGSDKRYRFRITSPGSKKVNVFEAEIDLLSYISLHGLKDENYIALGGVSALSLEAFCKESGQDIDHINLCLDNDPTGIAACERIEKKMGEDGRILITRDLPIGKDYNEDLLIRMDEEEIV